jgi:hypothetical protein
MNLLSAHQLESNQMEGPVKDAEFRPLTPDERQALIEKARRDLPELDRQIAHYSARLRRIAAGEFPTKPPRPL